ncbi:DUF1648 domain-containing protein [Bilifractor sp. HCP3S3_D3]|uniref:DUF1648 domain-containing protein n=1 Tax=Bilifractor sp. HCP3S3_D3 TaxID=3438907 RepID=UPI003F8C37B3
MKKIMWIISFVSLAGTAIVLQFMPDNVPMHYDMAGNIDRWGSKYENLLFPVIILAMSLFWTLFTRYYENKADKSQDEKEIAGAKSNAKVLSIVGLCMSVMFTVMQGFILYGSYTEAVSGAEKQYVDIGRVACILMGLGFLILGNFMTKTRINGTVGVRVSWSMYNDNTWRKTNFFGAVTLMFEGVFAIVAAIIMRSSFAAVMATLVVGIIITIATLIYAHKIYKEEIAAGR